MQPVEIDEDDLYNRAVSAYFNRLRRIQYQIDQPTFGLSGLQEVKGKRYIVLRNEKGVLAVYRLRNNGILKLLKWWPKELNTED